MESKRDDGECKGEGKKGECDLSSGEIVTKVSCFLFDLFDSPTMDEFHKIEAFENDNCSHFDPEKEEYTFKQEELHRESLSGVGLFPEVPSFETTPDRYVSMMESFVSEFIISTLRMSQGHTLGVHFNVPFEQPRERPHPPFETLRRDEHPEVGSSRLDTLEL